MAKRYKYKRARDVSSMLKASLDVVECALGEVDLGGGSDTTRDLVQDLGFGARSLHTNLID